MSHWQRQVTQWRTMMTSAVANTAGNGIQLLPEGLEMSLKIGEQTVEVAPDGKISWNDEDKPKHLSLELVVKPYYRFVAIVVDGSKNVVAKKHETTGPDQRFRYRLTVPIERSLTKRFTKAPANQIRIIKFRPKGVVEQWVIGVIAQEDNFWVVAQRMYEIPCYRDTEGTLVPVGWREWPQMITFLTEQFGPDGMSKLPEAPEELPAMNFGVELPEGVKLGDNQAWVAYFDEGKGFGSLVPPEGVKYSIHWTQIPPRTDLGTGRRFLKKGEIVTIGSTQPCSQPNGFYAAEAIGVSMGDLEPMPV
ncbi:MAG: hypothetical protein WCW26_01890 [Candidatus Buchananbacteria bacterium]